MRERPPHREPWPVSYGSYVRGCRCVGCSDASAEKKRAYREANREEIAEKQRAEKRQEEVGQCIARGLPLSQVMEQTGATYPEVMAFLEEAS